jgi:parallel beta-helix repeat protein
MRLSRRSTVAIGVFLLLAIAVAAGGWYETRKTTPGAQTGDSSVTASVTNGGDRGPGTLREALFIVAGAEHPAVISIQTKSIALETALPPIVTAHGLKIVATTAGAEIDAKALQSGAVLDIAGANTSIEGLTIRNCMNAGILLRASQFRLHSSTIDSCDVGVEVAENATDVLLELNHFTNNRVGVRFAASARNTSLVKNEFIANKEAGLWAVRSAPDSGSNAIGVRENKFTEGRIGMVIGNVSVVAERNELINAREAAIHVVGSGAQVRANRISGGASMGVVAENAKAAIIDDNEIDGLAAYGIMVRGSSNTLVRNNRVHNCGYGMAFVLGDAQSPTTAVENTVIEPKFNGIDVVGDSPILRRNRVLRPRALALHVEDFQPPGGQKITAKPFLDNNAFGSAADATAVVGSNPPKPPVSKQ